MENRIIVLCESNFNDRPEAPDVIYLDVDTDNWDLIIRDVNSWANICLIPTCKQTVSIAFSVVKELQDVPIVGGHLFYEYLMEYGMYFDVRYYKTYDYADVEEMVEAAREFLYDIDR